MLEYMVVQDCVCCGNPARLVVSHRYRLRQVAEQYNARLEERVRERTRVARELNDTLLQSIHGLMLHFHYASEALAENDPARPMLKAALQRADTAIVEGRNRVQLLLGPKSMDL
jgi:signal transduction histidine kinase